jgi:hypothetical protein
MSNIKIDRNYRGRLPDGSVVYRIISSKTKIHDGTNKPDRDVFIRRGPDPTGKPRDMKGLSFVIKHEMTFQELADFVLDNLNVYCYAFAELSVGSIHGIETTPPLEVSQDKDIHANLLGLPEHDQDWDKTYDLADKLTELANVVWRNPKPRPKR